MIGIIENSTKQSGEAGETCWVLNTVSCMVRSLRSGWIHVCRKESAAPRQADTERQNKVGTNETHAGG